MSHSQVEPPKRCSSPEREHGGDLLISSGPSSGIDENPVPGGYHRDKNKRFLLILSFLAFISLGLPDGLLGVAWPSIAGSFGISLSRLSLLQLAATCGFFISSTNAGRLIRGLGLGRLLLFSNAMVALALGGYILAPAWGFIPVAMFFLGTGGGAVDAGLNSYSAERFSKEEVTLLHAFYGLGAMTGPVVMRQVLGADLPWQRGYVIILGITVLMILLFFFSRKRWEEQGRGGSGQGAAEKAGHLDARESGTVAPGDAGAAPATCIPLKLQASGMALFLVYTGLEVTAGAWSFTWFTRGRGVDPEAAALWIGFYWGALMAGRIFFGFVGGRWDIRKIMWMMVLSVCVSTSLILQPWLLPLSLLGLAFLGFSCAPLFPLFVSHTPRLVRHSRAADLVGRQVAAASIGSAVVPLIVGAGVELFGLVCIPLLLVFLSLVMMLFYRLWVTA